MNISKHWEKIYSTKNIKEFSWYQENPQISLHLIETLKIKHTDKIIDIGGGDRFLIDALIDNGFENLSVLDISKKALDRVKDRLGSKSKKITWIHSDIIDFKTNEKFDLWHDRATFHFLNEKDDIQKYLNISESHIGKRGFLIVRTFAVDGPEKCSGLKVFMYSEQTLVERLSSSFKKIRCQY